MAVNIWALIGLSLHTASGQAKAGPRKMIRKIITHNPQWFFKSLSLNKTVSKEPIKHSVNQLKRMHTPTPWIRAYPLHILIPFFITHHLPHLTLMNMRHSRLQIRVTHSPSTATELFAASLIQLPSFMITETAAQPARSLFVLLAGTNGLIHMQAHTQNSRRALICIHIDMNRGVFMPSQSIQEMERNWEVVQEGHWDTSSPKL